MQYYLAIDLGASSGRHMLAHLKNGRMVLEEVYRFDNQMIDDNGCKCWDTDYLFAQIKAGMRLCAQLGKVPTAMGVDTWGVDFVLLDGQGRRLGPAVAYRDHRTQGMDEAVYRLIPEHDLFRRTGVTRQIYNTVYQLMALKTRQPDLLDQAETLLMTPDYYHYLLTGVKGAEYTIATTGQLVRLRTRDWDWPLIHLLEYPRRLFPPVRQPGEELGFLGCLLVIVLLLAIVVRCLLVARDAATRMEALVCVGFAAVLMFQTIANIGMCLFLLPVIGLTLPFFSYGGSSIVTLFAAMGIVSGIHKRSRPEWLMN